MNFPIPGLKDLLAVLDRWDGWKRLIGVPDRVEALEKRVDDLSQRLEALTAAAPGEVCPFCGARAFRLISSDREPRMTAAFREVWGCRACGEKREGLTAGARK